jgi:hypothetical protein
MITAEPISSPVPGLFGTTKKMVSPFKEMESNCIEDFYRHEGSFPKWNFQESNNKYPSDLSEEYGEFKANKTKKTNQ